MRPDAETEEGAGALRRVLRGVSTFLSASLGRQALFFLLLPLVTRAIPPEEFGRLALVLTVKGIAVVVFGSGMEAAIFRVWFDLAHDVPRRRSYIGTVRAWVLSSSVVWIAAATVVTTMIGEVFGIPPFWWVLGLLAAALQVVGEILPSALLRAQERFDAFLRVKIVEGIASASLLFGFVIVADLGALGWLFAIVGGSAIAWIASFLAVLRDFPITFDPSALRAALGFGLPLVPHSLSQWTLSGADRLVLATFVSAGALGVYSLTYQVASALSLVYVELNRAVMVEYGRHLDDTAGPGADLSKVAAGQIAVTLLLGFAAVVLGPPLIELVFPPEYASGLGLVPYLVSGFVLFGAYLVPANVVSMIHGRTNWFWLPTVTAALTNLGLNIALVPPLGITGAAVATAGGYGVLLILMWTHEQQVTPNELSLPWTFLALATVGLAGGSVLWLATAPAAVGMQLAIGAGVVLVAATGLLIAWHGMVSPLRGSGA